ncbi:hypothetical protein LRI_0731 [Limosilactobacillus reuteri I5007]|uniref:Uncharacterized protein n=2 Tax=Limosilactobacillus reuteri TaxID=1598 RepID=A0A0U5JYR8_LIMRT|nr:hypothetical protein LRI_0731 [Limosilactobacillus reuteri I5007]CUR37173.1 FIG00744110: hypothetical protein [Limosilactobacillus reuteri]CUR41698.1 FIG00744110: hypothetical protein [Limosilactobacillus reuteri]
MFQAIKVLSRSLKTARTPCSFNWAGETEYIVLTIHVGLNISNKVAPHQI